MIICFVLLFFRNLHQFARYKINVSAKKGDCHPLRSAYKVFISAGQKERFDNDGIELCTHCGCFNQITSSVSLISICFLIASFVSQRNYKPITLSAAEEDTFNLNFFLLLTLQMMIHILNHYESTSSEFL